MQYGRPSQVDAQLQKTEALGAEIFRHTYYAPEIAKTAVPGQFCMVQIGQELDPLLRRPFSIHAVSLEGNIQILFKVIGKGTKALSEKNIGCNVDILGPLGKGFEDISGVKCLIGGGMGIAPLYFLAQWFIAKNAASDLVIYLGARNKDEISRVYENFSALTSKVSVATDDGSLGRQGFVTDYLTELTKQSKNKLSVYSCGPHPMLKKVAKISHTTGNKCQVSLETMMACGISACLGCAIQSTRQDKKYLHVCKDGPVFKADAVDWT